MIRPGALFLGVLLCAQCLQAQDEEKNWRDVFAEKYETPRDFGHDWKLGTLFGVTPEDGLLLGAGAILYEFGFRKMPYVYRMELVAGGTWTGRGKVLYNLFMPSLSKHLMLDLHAHVSGVEVRNFFGLGNTTPRIRSRDDDGFYRVGSTEVLFRPVMYYAVGDVFHVGAGLSFKHLSVRKETDRYLSGDSLAFVGNPRSHLGAGITLVYDRRDHPLMPHAGVYASCAAWNFIDPFKGNAPFRRVSGDIRVYLGDTLFTDVALALRVAGERIFGDFPFYEAAFLGGAGSLRGYALQRFGGDASLLASAELRVSLFRPRLLVPTEVGIFLLADAGRVWLDDASPGSVHSDVGGGIWLAPLSRDIIVSFVAAQSVDGLYINGGLGFGF